MTCLAPSRLFFFLLAMALVMLGFQAGEARAKDRRVAFVVGNSAYQSVASLPNPKNDADAVAKSLRASGFEVITALDLAQVGFEQEFERFIRSMNGADVSVFYYSGHGFQVGGDNRIVPVDAMLQSSSDMEVETISLRTIVSYMQSNSKTQLIYLDACRNNPFPSRQFYVGNDNELQMTSVGLAAADGALGSLVAYSTQPGDVAVDGLGDKSPFTDAFLKRSFRLGVEVSAALEKVTEDVWNATQQRQRPYIKNALTQPVYLKLPALQLSPSSVSLQADAGTALKVGSAPTEGMEQLEVEMSSAMVLANLMAERFKSPRRVPIGIGAISMLEDFSQSRSGPETTITLASAPVSGTVSLDGATMVEGSTFPESVLRQLSFEPAIGAEGKNESLSFAVASSMSPETASFSLAIEPYINACDSVAAEPFDLQGINPGVPFADLEIAQALEVCTQAVGDYPSSARYRYQLGRTYLAQGNIEAALDSLRKAADQGHVRALYQLGYMHQRGLGVPKDQTEANRLFQLASDKGDPLAMAALGRNHANGIGLPKDLKTAVALMNRAAELGYAEALSDLGTLHADGNDVTPNPDRGVRFFQAGFARNDAASTRKLAQSFRDGMSVRKDVPTAAALFKRAAVSGNTSAAYDLAKLYFDGKLLLQNSCSAVEWYDYAVRRGNIAAALALGRFYASAAKPARNLEKSAEYFAIAAALDADGTYPEALTELQKLPANAKRDALARKQESMGLENTDAPDTDVALVDAMRKSLSSSSIYASKLALRNANLGQPRALFQGISPQLQLVQWVKLQDSKDQAAVLKYMADNPDGIFLLPALARFQQLGGKLEKLPGDLRQAITSARFIERRELFPFMRDDTGTCKILAVPKVVSVAAPKATAPVIVAPKKLVAKKKKIVAAKPPKKIKPTGGICGLNKKCAPRSTASGSGGGNYTPPQNPEPQRPSPNNPPDTTGGGDPTGGDNPGNGSPGGGAGGGGNNGDGAGSVQ